MRKTGIIVFAFCALVTLAAVSPALASVEITYSVGVLSISIPNTGSTNYPADKIEVARNQEGISWDFGHPWGQGISPTTIDYQLNVDSNSKNYLTGNGVDRFVTQYATGILSMVTTLKFEGFGTFTYHGPTITQSIPGYGQVTVKELDTFMGITFTGQSIGHGNLASEDVKTQEAITGVVVLVGNLAGMTVICGTGTAK